MTVTLIEEGERTRVRIHQTGFPNGEQRDGHSRGWRHYLRRLADVAGGDDPGPDPRREVA